MVQKTFTKACMDFFGKRQGQSTMEFAKELKALTPNDKSYFADLFATVGVEVVAAR